MKEEKINVSGTVEIGGRRKMEDRVDKMEDRVDKYE